ncbi:hypothetical protein V8C40DRAFT_254832 [Trichoderma camerunense]
MSLILCISFSFFVLLGFLFQSLPFVGLSRWTWGSGGCSIITGVSLGCLFSPYFFCCVPPSLVRQLGILFHVPMHGVLIRIWSLLQVAAVGVSSELSRLFMARGPAYIAALLQIEKNISAHLDGDIVWLALC